MDQARRRAQIFERKAADVGDHEIDRILTAPNVITAVRALAIPLFIWFLAHDHLGRAGWLLGFMSATDWVDGYVARRFDQGSTFGKMFDPIVDRLLLVVGIAGSIIVGAPPAWYAWLIIVREVLVSLWVVVITAMGAKRMDVTWWGKCAAFANMFAFPCFLIAAEPSYSDAVRTGWRVAAYVGLVPGVIFGVLSALQYVPLGLRALREGRTEHSATH